MKKIIYKIELIGLCIVIWIILTENISIQNISLGTILVLLSLYITDHVLLLDNYKKRYYIRPFLFLKYFSFVIIQIYISGFATIKKIVLGNINPDIVEIETKLENDIYRCFLANSITLTPGTVTIDKNEHRLKVLWIDCITKDQEKAGEIIKGKFEKILLKG